ncbi:MAG: hypothetical protein ACYC8T_08705 [Myxococcaceae bacterium]
MITARLVAALLLAAPLALAADPKPKAPAKTSKLKMDLGLPTFGALPRGDDVVKPKLDKPMSEPTVTATNATYQVLRVQHGRSFMRTATGAVPTGGGMPFIPLVGDPPSIDKFTTVIRMKSPQRVNANIDVVILDPRGDTAMTASGEVNFRAQGGDEVDYTIDWDKTPARAGGPFKVMVRLSGQVMGTWPLQVGEPPKAAPEPAK